MSGLLLVIIGSLARTCRRAPVVPYPVNRSRWQRRHRDRDRNESLPASGQRQYSLTPRTAPAEREAAVDGGDMYSGGGTP